MATRGSSSSSSERAGSRRPTTVRGALTRAVAEAREAGRMTAEHEVRALMADQLAAAADRAAKAEDATALLRVTERLLEVLDTLPVRPIEAPGGGAAGVGSSERGRVLELLDSPPQVGHTADA